MATRGAPRGRGYARGRGGSSFRGRGGTYKHGVWRAPDDLSPITHPAYADEDDSGADLVIQTSDNVLFRVHSYHLKAASTFFRAMPVQNDTPCSPNADTTIHIDAISDAFKVLLDLVTDAMPIKAFLCSYYNLTQALSLGDQLGFAHLPRKALPFMHRYAKSFAWAVFIFAANNDFPVLAAYAIDKFQFAHELAAMNILNVDYAMFDGIPGKYTGPLVRNMTLFRNEAGVTDWRKVSHNFPKLEKHRVSHTTNRATLR